MVAIWCGQPFWSLPLPLPLPLSPPLSLPLFLPFFPPLGKVSLPFCWAKRWDHSPGAGFSQQWYKGSYSIHNPVLLAKRSVLLRGQMVAYYHGWATVPRRASAVNPSLCDPRVRNGRPKITPLGVQQTYFQGGILCWFGETSTTHCQ